MAGPTIHLRNTDDMGVITDGERYFDLSDFPGFLPAVGDMILQPSVLQRLNRSDSANRQMLSVEQRVFNPCGLEDYVALACRSRPGAS